MLATRPILLHVLRTRLEAKVKDPSLTFKIPAPADTLSKTCVRCARHSYQLLVESWVDGSFMVFDYFYTQYLFSAMTILAISSLLDHQDSQSDEEQFDLASNLLKQLKDVGNYAAGEFYQHNEAMKELMPAAKQLCRHTHELTSSVFDTTDHMTINLNEDQQTTASVLGVTAETALSDPFLVQLLEQPLPDLEFFDASICMDGLQGTY